MHGAIGVRSLAALLIVSTVASGPAWAEPVTAEPVMVALAPAPTSDPLPLRSQSVLTDRIQTGDRAFARLLFGGRVMVLAREGSSLRITEVPGAMRIDVERGRIAVTVDRANLHPEDLVEVRTPHAVVSVPAETVIVDVAPTASTFTAFGPRMEVFRLDPATGLAVEPPTPVGGERLVTIVPPSPSAEVVANR